MATKLIPKETALIVIDMQYDFYGPEGNAVKRKRPVTKMHGITRKLEQFAQRIEEKGGLVIFTRYVSGPGVTPKNLQIAVEKEGGKLLCAIGSGGEALFDIHPPQKAIIIAKPHYDSFVYTNLKELLQKNHIKNVLITGVRTEVCVDATAKRAASEGYNTYIVSDLVATYDDKYEIHDYMLNFFKNYYGFVLKSDEILWNSQPGPTILPTL